VAGQRLSSEQAEALFEDILGGQLDDAQIAAVISHVRTSFGNSAGAVTADEVKAERAKTKDHAAPWNGDLELDKLK
jgi:anthranilate phosphoribosyltransferase